MFSLSLIVPILFKCLYLFTFNFYLVRYHSYIFLAPSLNEVECLNPSECSFEESRNFLGVPSGF